MTLHPKRLILGGLLASLVLTAMAQTPPPAAASPAPAASAATAGDWRMRHGDPATFHQRRLERHNQRLAALKTQLKLNPAQEAAWASFAQALQPPSSPSARPNRAEWEKLTTPERIDRMQALRKEHDTTLTRRAEATKAFYAKLSAEQKKVFDAESLRSERRHGDWGGEGSGPHGRHPMR